MNNPFAYQNDLNAFRGAVAAEQNSYDAKVNILQNTQLAKRTKALTKAKEFAEKGEELVKQGLEAAAVPHLGKLTYKAGKSIYNKIRSRNTASREAGDEDLAEGDGNIPGSSTTAEAGEGDAIQNVSSQGGGEVEMTNMAEEGDSGATELQEMTQVGGRQGFQPNGAEEAERYEREGLGNETMTDEQLHNINERAGMRANDIDAPEEPGQVRPRGNAVEDQDTLGENRPSSDNLGEDLAEDAGDAEEAGADVASGAADALSGIGSGVEAASGAAAAAGEAVSGGVAAAEGIASGLAEAAAATSWVPFLGEILAGAAGVAGIAAAGVGVYDEIAAGGQEAAAEKIPAQLKRSQLPPASVAGGYIAPLQSSVQM